MKNSQTIQAYNKFASVYNQETKYFWDNFPDSIVDKFCEVLPGKKVLDIGSGPGRDALILQSRGLEVVCLDAAESMVRITKSLGFESVFAEFRDLNFSDSLFDGVWAYTSLLHVSPDECIVILRKIHDILKPRGAFLIGMIEGHDEDEIERESMPGTKRYFHYYQALELKNIIEKIGFKFVYQEKYQPHHTVYLNQIYLKP